MTASGQAATSQVKDHGRVMKPHRPSPTDNHEVLTDFAGALPLESLLRTVAEHIGVRAVFHDEVREVERRVRLDYGQRRRTINGYIEVKAPGHVLDPASSPGMPDSSGNVSVTCRTSSIPTAPIGGCTGTGHY
jgi:hypothetical protein